MRSVLTALLFLVGFAGSALADSFSPSTTAVEVPKIRAAAAMALKNGAKDDYLGCWTDDRGQKVCIQCALDFWSTDVYCFPVFDYLPEYTFDGRCHASQFKWDLYYDCFYRRHAGRFIDAVRQKFPEMLRVIKEEFYGPVLDVALLRLFDFLPEGTPSTPEAYVCALLARQNTGVPESDIERYEDEELDRQYAGGVSPKRLYRQIAGAQGVELRARKLADYHRYRLELRHTSWDGYSAILWSDSAMVTNEGCKA